MNKLLIEAQSKILQADDPVSWVALADLYIEMANRSGRAFVLPEQHKILAPVISAYKSDEVGFVNYVKEIRDSTPRSIHPEMHKLFRRFNSRLAQKQRRLRLNMAVDAIAQELGVEFTANQKTSVADWLELLWGKERVEALNEAKGNRPSLTTDERALVCDAFWEEKMKNIVNNVVPIPPEIVYARK